MNSNQHKVKNSGAIKKILAERHALRITECKKTFWGSEICVDCKLIYEESDRVSLFHAIEKKWIINGTVIEPPMFTIATYWTGRPYNLYCWFKSDGSYVAAYFNVVELPGYQFENDTLVYHDFVLDVLVLPNQRPVILDTEELSDMDKVKSTQAKRVSELLLKSAVQIVNESLSTLPKWMKRKRD